MFMNECIDSKMGHIHVCFPVLIPSDDPRTNWSFQVTRPHVLHGLVIHPEYDKYVNLLGFQRESLHNISEYTLNMSVSRKSDITSYCETGVSFNPTSQSEMMEPQVLVLEQKERQEVLHQ
jgi:hypothetical protein